MKFKLLPLLLASSYAAAQPLVNQDSMVFKDGGNLYGEFKGFSPDGLRINWARKAAKHTQEYEVKAISQISINGGRPTNNAPHSGYINLVNGDRLPCQLKDLDPDFITISTTYSGEIKLPRNSITSYLPAPDGASLIINGFGKNHTWENRPFNVVGSTIDEKKPKHHKWELHGAAYYAHAMKSGMLINPELQLPDEFVCKFLYAYQEYPTLNIILHADMMAPKKEKEILNKEAEDAPNQPNIAAKPMPKGRAVRLSAAHQIANTFGSTLHLSLGPGSNQLTSISFDPETAAPLTASQQSTIPRSYTRRQINELSVEIRASRKRRQLTLLIDGKAVAEWFLNDTDYPKKGKHLAFFCTPSGTGSIRISNFSISEWHGVADTPKSMVNEQQDIILLNNNTDRFAGNLDKFDAGNLFFSNAYFNLKFPEQKVKRINFSTSQLTEAKELSNGVSIDFFNQGNITGKLQHSDSPDTIILKTQYADKITINKADIRAIKLEDISDLIESWTKKH